MTAGIVGLGLIGGSLAKASPEAGGGGRSGAPPFWGGGPLWGPTLNGVPNEQVLI